MKTDRPFQLAKSRLASSPSPNLGTISPKRDASISLKGIYPPRSSSSPNPEMSRCGSAGNGCGAPPIIPDETERAAVNAFLLCMTWVMAATGASFGCIALAYHQQWLAAVLTAKLAAMMWAEALHKGRQSARLFTQLDADDHAS